MRFSGIRWNRRTAGIGAAIVATAVAGTASLAAAGFGEDDAVWGEGTGPVSTALHTVAFPAANGREVTIPRRDTERFAMVGVTWTNPNVGFKGTIAVRTHGVDGTWSGWRSLELDNHFGPEPGAEATAGKARGGTDPLWVGQSDGVEVRATAAGGGTSDHLPAGLRLELVDPGLTKRRKAGAAGVGHVRPERLQPVAEVQALEPTPTDPAPTDTAPTGPAPTDAPTTTAPAETTAPAPTETTAPPAATTAPAPTTTSAPAPTTTPTAAPTATAPANPVPTPKVVTRAEWKADESIVTDPPTYGTTVKAFFVHHTAGSNDYSCADSAALVRGIEIYHVKSNGWNDIGYNFLVDKCGVVFEGRKGGIDKPVTGAHTYGFNTDNAAIAVLGTYISAGIPTGVQDAIAHVAAYKLRAYGNDPFGKVTLTSGVEGKYHLGEQVVFNRISGHRDAVATECPGDALYGQLATIRAKAATIANLRLTGLSGTLRGTTYYTKSTFTASWTTITPSNLISRFDVVVDGAVVATAAGTARSASVTVPAGAHTVVVRGVHLVGRVNATAGQAFVVDTTAPTFPQGPTLALRTGQVSGTVVPVTVNWRAADNTGVGSVQLTAPLSRTFAASGSYGTTTKPSVATTWSMRAQDWAGNTATTSASWTPVFLPETKATRTGTWSTATGSSYLGGSALTSTTAKSSLTWTVTGRSVAFVATRTSTSGQAEIWVDGVKQTTVDLRYSTTDYRRVMWTKSWSSSARHTVKIVVVGTSGRPRVITDGLVYIG
ncbi:N-acetylmuramoyl-L-alanine amidase [Micromonospora sp. NBC_00898]|uniref:N-acetylmuramoyl-L-alanine amidase n=1 Tax=Micromonospora sp. NBC_00898 TaxID=2975981 RepID=UPI003869E31C|nr:N-acetylmuramoyl-L-alanine amidase [Micromonospora sp. NBC_00898]